MKAVCKYLVICSALIAGNLLLVSCTAPPSARLSSNEDATTYQLVIDLLGTKYEVLVDDHGRLTNSVELASANGKVNLLIYKDTKFLDKDKKPLQHMEVATDNNLTRPPENAEIIGDIYKIIPEGAIIDPPLSLTLSYDTGELPKDVDENDVYISSYIEDTGWGKWQYKRVDTENHKVTTKLSQFSRFAVLAPLPITLSQFTSTPTFKVDLASKSLAKALSSGKPTLAEFGWRTCIPCKEMKPILEELAVKYEGKLNVVIVEVYEQEELTSQYGIRSIPTQILFDSGGKEIMRHAGLWPKAEIITQLKKRGIE